MSQQHVRTGDGAYHQIVAPVVHHIDVAGGLIGLAWGFVVFGMALRKRYSGFRLALVPTTT